MRSRILKRPMFRLGGSAENEGIMDGMRKRYEQGTKPEDIDSTYTAAGADFKPTNETTQTTTEKPSFRDLCIKLSSRFKIFIFERTSFKKLAESTSFSPKYLRFEFTADFKNEILLTPGIATGYWNDKKTPSLALSSVSISNNDLPLYVTLPLEIL